MYAKKTLTFLPLFLALACAPKKSVVHDTVLVPPKPRTDPGVILFDGAVAHELLASGVPGTTLVRLRLRTKELTTLPRPKINLALVVDTSGSMEGKAIVDARRASLALVDSMKPGDRLAVIAFGSRAELLVPSTVLDATTLEDVRAKIDRMKAEGTTDMAAGLRIGIDEVAQYFASDGINRVVLLGDGVPNDETPILPMAQSAGQRGIAITSLGLGSDYNETLMGAIATTSGGRFHYIDESDKVAQVFVDEVLRLTHTVGRALYVTVRPGPGVTIMRIPGHQVAPGTDTTIPLGDLAEGDERDVILELATPARKRDATIELVDAFLSYDDAVNQSGRHERHVYLATHTTDDAAAIAKGEDQDVIRAAARAALAAAVLEAIAAARQGKLDEARAILDRAERAARAAMDKLPDGALEEALSRLAPLRSSLPTLVPPPPVEIVQPPQSELPPRYDPEPIPTASSPPAPANAPVLIRESHESATRTIQRP